MAELCKALSTLGEDNIGEDAFDDVDGDQYVAGVKTEELADDHDASVDGVWLAGSADVETAGIPPGTPCDGCDNPDVDLTRLEGTQIIFCGCCHNLRIVRYGYFQNPEFENWFHMRNSKLIFKGKSLENEEFLQSYEPQENKVKIQKKTVATLCIDGAKESFVEAASLKNVDPNAVDILDFNGKTFVGVKGSIDTAGKMLTVTQRMVTAVEKVETLMPATSVIDDTQVNEWFAHMARNIDTTKAASYKSEALLQGLRCEQLPMPLTTQPPLSAFAPPKAAAPVNSPTESSRSLRFPIRTTVDAPAQHAAAPQDRAPSRQGRPPSPSPTPSDAGARTSALRRRVGVKRSPAVAFAAAEGGDSLESHEPAAKKPMRQLGTHRETQMKAQIVGLMTTFLPHIKAMSMENYAEVTSYQTVKSMSKEMQKKFLHTELNFTEMDTQLKQYHDAANALQDALYALDIYHADPTLPKSIAALHAPLQQLSDLTGNPPSAMDFASSELCSSLQLLLIKGACVNHSINGDFDMSIRQVDVEQVARLVRSQASLFPDHADSDKVRMILNLS